MRARDTRGLPRLGATSMPVDFQRTEEELLEREQLRARGELRSAFGELSQEVSTAVGLRRQLGRHPLLFVSSATLVGFVLGGPVRRLLGRKHLGRGLFLSLLAFSVRSGIGSLMAGWMSPTSDHGFLRGPGGWLLDQLSGPRRTSVRRGHPMNH